MRWIYLAQCWLSAPFHKSRLTLGALQLHCLVLLARQTNYVGPELVWVRKYGAIICFSVAAERVTQQITVAREAFYWQRMPYGL